MTRVRGAIHLPAHSQYLDMEANAPCMLASSTGTGHDTVLACAVWSADGRLLFGETVRFRMFTHADRLWRHLHKLTINDILDSILERQLHRGRGARLFVRAGGAHVGQLLSLADIHLQIARLGMDAHDLVLVHVVARAREEGATVLNLGDCKRGRSASFERDEV